MSEGSDSASSSSSDEDYPPQVDEEFEKSFLKTLSSLKKNDPSIYDKDTKFFDESVSVVSVKKDKSSGKVKPLFLKDYERKVLTENEGYEEDSVDVSRIDSSKVPYTVEQRQIKESFKAFLNDSDDEETLLKPLVKSDQEVQKAEADYVQWLKGQKQELEDKATEEKLKNLRDFWNSDNLDKDEAFLRDYILNKKFLDEELSDQDEHDLSEDSEILEEQETFEQEYNFRYETGDNLIRRFPRNIEDSLRRKDNRRSKKRAEVKSRKELEKKKKREEINRQKKIKVKEISERLEQLKQLTGNEKLAFNDDDILNDFDPTEHDKKMAEMYNDEFYDQEDCDKPNFDDIDQGETYEDPDNLEIEYDEQISPNMKSKKGKKTRTKLKRERKKAFNDILSIDKPIYDPKLHESYKKYMEEYYELDCEDFIDDLPCRFKYKKVEPNDFGLSVEEILMADDKELNSWSSIKKIIKIRSSHVEKNEAKMYKIKGQNESLKMKILPSLYKTEEDEGNKDDVDNDSISKNKNNSIENSSKIVENNDEISDKKDSDLDNTSINISKSEKRKKRKRKTHSTNDIVEDIHSVDKTDSTANGSIDNVHSQTKRFKESPSTANASSFKTFNESQKPFEHHNKFNQRNKFKGGRKGKFNRNHNFHDSRLSAYGINPKKFKIKS